MLGLVTVVLGLLAVPVTASCSLLPVLFLLLLLQRGVIAGALVVVIVQFESRDIVATNNTIRLERKCYLLKVPQTHLKTRIPGK